MKKLLLILILLLTGCTHEFQIEEDITEAKYGDIEIIKEDLEEIKTLVNSSKFNNKQADEKFNDTLVIKTKSNLYKFKISKNYIEHDGYYAKNQELVNYLEKIEKKYYNADFYQIEYKKNYTLEENVQKILLDNVDDYIIINTEEDLNDFKINLEEFNGNDYDDVDLLYSKDKVEKGKIVIRKNLEKTIIKISFKNPYNYAISIVVKNEDGKVTFDTTYK